MYRHLFKAVITIITILSVNLLTNYISNYMVTYKSHYKPLTYTLIEMGIVIVIFYPLFIKMEDWVNSLSIKLVIKGRSIAGKYVGLVLAFAVSLSVLFYLYAKLWYKLDIVKILFSGNISHYF